MQFKPDFLPPPLEGPQGPVSDGGLFTCLCEARVLQPERVLESSGKLVRHAIAGPSSERFLDQLSRGGGIHLNFNGLQPLASLT